MAVINYTKKAEDCVVDNDEAAQKMAESRKNGPKRPIRFPHGHDHEKEAQKADYRDGLTLDHYKENDEEMLKYAVKNSKRYFFDSPLHAQAFMGRCVQMTLNRCGCMILEGMPGEYVQKSMDKNKIQVENRSKNPVGHGLFYQGNEAWKNGLYIFKAGELVAFVSIPMVEQPSKMAINQILRPFVVTNAKIHVKGFR